MIIEFNPETHVLVPIDPTEAMCDAPDTYVGSNENHYLLQWMVRPQESADIYRKMIASAPAAPAQQDHESANQVIAAFGAKLISSQEPLGIEISSEDLWKMYERGHAAPAQPVPDTNEQFCDAHCVWTDHHPDCDLHTAMEQKLCAYPNCVCKSRNDCNVKVAQPVPTPKGMSLIRNEDLADLYIKLSGKRTHASDCATSCAPAETPGPCDCDVANLAQPVPDTENIDTLRRDAERYQWMRRTFINDDETWTDEVSDAKTGDELDAAIDAAMQAKGEAKP